jgi:hypothetical protein
MNFRHTRLCDGVCVAKRRGENKSVSARIVMVLMLVQFFAMHWRAPGATFTANGGHGSSTVGASSGHDYLSLAAAGDDFTLSAQPVTGNYTFYLEGSLVEDRQIRFAKNTNGFTVTLRPVLGQETNVSFNYSSQNNGTSNTFEQTKGCPGQIIIGMKDLSNTANALNTGFVQTNNFVIDGDWTTPTYYQHLKLSLGPMATHFKNSRIIHILGSNNCVVKNCTIANESVDSPPFGIYVVSYRMPIENSVPATSVYPALGTVIHNNNITVPYVGTGKPIAFNGLYDGQISATGQNGMPPGTAPSGYQITNNNIYGRLNGIYLNYAA